MNKMLAMRTFVAVVEQGGFTAAMDQLSISRAGVSKHIADLETELGSRLLNRTTRRVSMTEAGQAYYQRCKEILAMVEEADSVVSGLTATPSGLLRINAPMSFGYRHMGSMVAAFRKRYPGLKVELTLSDRIVDMVEEGFDVTIRISQPQDSSLIARKIAPCHFALAGSPDYLVRYGTPVTPNELSSHQCLTYSYGPRHQWRFFKNDKEFVVKLDSPIESNNGDFLCGAAESHAGIVYLPTFILCDAFRSGKLVPLLENYLIKPVGIYAVYPSSRLIAVKVRMWVDFMVETLGDSPHWDQL